MSTYETLVAGEIANLPTAVYHRLAKMVRESDATCLPSERKADAIVSSLYLPTGQWLAWELTCSVDGELIPAVRLAWDGTGKVNAGAVILSDGRTQVSQYPRGRTVRAANALASALAEMAESTASVTL